MSNILTAVTPKLLAQGLLALRKANVAPRLVNSSYGNDARQKGSVIDVPVPKARSATPVSPSSTPATPTDVTPGLVQVQLDQWYESDFYLTDKEMLEVMDGHFPMMASEAIKALADNVNSYILTTMYKGLYGWCGATNAHPFASSLQEAVDARKVLSDQEAPFNDRAFVVNTMAAANLLMREQFTNAQISGRTEGIIEGQLGRRLGFDWNEDQQVPTHTAGTITTGLSAKSATNQAIGTTAVVCTTAASTGACALLKGDIITFASDSQTYVLTANATQASASSDVTLNIYPGLKKALTGGQAVTVKASHVANVAFQRNCFAFATRPLEAATEGLGVITMSAVDPVTGLSLRIEVTRQNKQTRWAYDILYGGNVVRPELGVRCAGQP